MQWQRDIEVLTPLFNRGAYQDTPELRVPSIRGMVRWWFRELGGTADEEKEAFGGMNQLGQRLCGQANASRLVLRVSNVHAHRASPNPATLPHKEGGQSSPQAAFSPGATFRLEVFSRFSPLPDPVQRKAVNALEVWLLLGALGLRANRSGGNVWPANGAGPETPLAFRKCLDELGCRWPVMIVGTEAGTTLEQLRASATDTVKSPESVFGCARGRERLASGLKFKIVRLENQLRLVATAREQQILDEARRCLAGHRSKPETWRKIEA
jgi:CRISPR type III-B/RAMP module RAMP protein Cmr1